MWQLRDVSPAQYHCKTHGRPSEFTCKNKSSCLESSLYNKHTHSGNLLCEGRVSRWPLIWRSKQIVEIFLSVSFYSAVYQKKTLAEIINPGVHPISSCFDWLGFSKWYSHKQRDIEILIWNPVFLSDADITESGCWSSWRHCTQAIELWKNMVLISG